MKIIPIAVLFFMSFCLWAQEQETPPEKEQTEQEESQASEEKPVGVDAFYENRGFDLTPKTEALQWKNVFSSSFYSDSNIFLVDGDDRQDDFVWANQLQTDLRYVQKNWQLGVTGIFRYEDYVDENSLDEFLPSGSVDFSYQGKMLYFSLKEAVSRDSSPNVADLNDRSPRKSHRIENVMGIQYKQLTVELLTFHTYTDFEDVEGDVHNYGQALTFKYRLRENITAILETDWDYINYREAAIIINEKQDDNFGYKVLPGIEIALSKRFYALFQLGIDYRDSFEYLAIKAFMSWQPSDNWRLTSSILRQTIPTFSGNFQLLTATNINAEYLLSDSTVLKSGMGVLHINPENGATSYNYTFSASMVHRFLDGLELEIFSDVAVKDDSGADYAVLKLGVSFNVVF